MSEPVAQLPASLTAPDRGPGSSDQTSPLLLLHRCLRGRYPIAVALGLLLAAPFAFLGYHATTPKYRSTGLVRVMPTLPSVAYRIEENQLPPLFDSLVTTQAAILRSRRVLDLAVNDPKLRASGWPAGVQGVALLERTLTVTNERNSELIKVTVTHTDARQAQAALNAVLSAFEEIQDEFSGTNATQREQKLTLLQSQLSKDLRDLQDEILNLSLEHGTANLDPIYHSRVNDITRLQEELAVLDRQIDAIEAQQAAATAASPEEALPSDEALAASDQVLGSLLKELAGIDAQIRAMEADYGPNHFDMIALRRSRAIVQDQVDARKKMLLEARLAAGGVGAPDPAIAGMGLAQLKRLRESTAQRLAKVDEEFIRLHRARLTINRLKDREADLKRQHDEVSAQLHKLTVERQNIAQGRVLVAQRGELPTGPARDRRKELAAVGAMGGVGLGVLLVAGFGFLRYGYRYIDDVEHGALSVPLLGTIPDLRQGDPEHDELAALSVHHLRNMLEQSGPPGPRAVHAVTSGSSGDGKTSLVLALGMSFAVSGHRTLLLDADLVGRRLSRLLGLSKQPGLADLVGKAGLNGEVHQTRVPNLWAIPAGSNQDFSPEKLSTADFDRLLEQLRGRFDRVIIDTGPILGSLEASLVCPLADRVVLIVSAGQNPKLVQAAIRRLQQLGAECAGMVFNRARRDDFDRSVSAAPMSRSIRSVAPPREEEEEAERYPATSLIRALESDRAARGGPAA